MASYITFVINLIVLLYCDFAVSTRFEHLSRRTEKRQFAALGHAENYSESGPAPELVMSCDISEDGFRQEDALILNLRFAEDSGHILRSLKEQQVQISSQMNEIWDLFKETHKEQSRLLQMQNALRQQNAQIMALLSNAVRSKMSTDTPGFSQDLLDIWANTRPPSSGHNSGSETLDHVTRPSPLDRNVTDQNPKDHNATSDTGDHEEKLDTELPEDVLRTDVLVNDHPMTTKRNSEPGHLVERNLEILCQSCHENEYCIVDGGDPQCFPCTECSLGYTVDTPCTKYRDVVCEDKNECTIFGQTATCQESGTLCVNTPGGYLCVGGDASCIDDYYFNRRSSQCEPCSACSSLQHVIVPCSKFSDSICRTDDMEQQTDVWTGSLRKPKKQLKSIGELNEGYTLLFNDISENNQTAVEVTKLRRKSRERELSSPKRDAENSIKLLQHGVIWMEYNMALRHSCRSYLQTSLLISNAPEGVDGNGAVMGRTIARNVQTDTSHKTLASTRLEHSSGDRYKFVSLAAVAEIQPGQEIKADLRSAHRGCVTNPKENDQYVLQSIATNSRSGPLSVLWLSHNTGAVAYRATTKNGRGYSSLYAEFAQEYASDLHVVQLSQSGRFFEFAEPGIILAKYHQALYTIGEPCVEHGYSMICTLERTEGESGETLVRSQKSGVSYTDTAMSLSVMTAVEGGDRLTFDLQTPAGCQVRYMSELNLGVVNLLWVPRQSSAGLLARLDHRDEIIGSVRSKVLSFVETQNTNPTRINLRSASYFEFKEAGRIYVSYVTRAIHSCDYLKVAINYVNDASGSPNSDEIVLQVLGDTNGRWDGISLGVSHTVQVGSMCYVSLTCVRGRIDEMSYGEWSTLSILWLPL